MRRSVSAHPEVEAALAVIRGQKWPEQFEAIQQLASSKANHAAFVLLYLLDHRSLNIREAVLVALAEHDRALAQLAARAALDDPSSFVRKSAAELLGGVGNSEDVRRLAHALHDSTWLVRACAADSLGYIGGKTTYAALTRALKNDLHPVVRRDAAYALAASKDVSMVPILKRALKREKREQAKLGILVALYALGKRKRLPALLKLLRSKDYRVRYAVVNALKEHLRPEDREQTIVAIRAMLKNETSPGLKSDAIGIIDVLSSKSTSRTAEK